MRETEMLINGGTDLSQFRFEVIFYQTADPMRGARERERDRFSVQYKHDGILKVKEIIQPAKKKILPHNQFPINKETLYSRIHTTDFVFFSHSVSKLEVC